MLRFLSTLSLRRATISAGREYDTAKNFYPRSPCGERPFYAQYRHLAKQFLSTLSLRRATCLNISKLVPAFYFYPRSPCGERLLLLRKITITVDISIHALLAESDGKSNKLTGRKLVFLSTLSLRRATISARRVASESIDFYPRSPCGERQAANGLADTPPEISIHALLAESDSHLSMCNTSLRVFLSTLSLRRATSVIT